MIGAKEHTQLFGPRLPAMEFERFKGQEETQVVQRVGKLLLDELKRHEDIKEAMLSGKMKYVGLWPYQYSKWNEMLSLPMDGPQYSKGETLKTALREDLTFDGNTGLYTTLMAQFIEQAIRTVLLNNNVLKVLSGINPAGGNAIKVPLQVHHSVETLGDAGDIATTRTENAYLSTTLTAAWYYCAAGLTQELMSHSVADLMKDQLGMMGFAMGKKSDQVIVAALATATPSDNSKDNYKALGATTKMTWDGLTTELGRMQITHDTSPDVLITNPVTWATMLQDDDIRTAVQYASIEGKIAPKMNPHKPGVTTTLLDMDVIVTSLAGAKATYFVDRNWAGYFAPFVPLNVVDGRISGKLAWEIVSYQAYAAAVTQTGSVHRILDNTA